MVGSILAELHADDDFLLLAKAVGEFSERELVPYLQQLGSEEFPQQFIPLAAQRGFLGTVVPAVYGGHGGSLEGFLPVLEGLAACDGSLALTLAAHESLATTHILLGGNDEQKRKYLPDLTQGRKIGAWCLTEPQAGSNIFNDTRTKLIKKGETWRLHGEKTFITNGCHADLFVVLAQAVGQDGHDAGMTACVAERKGNEDRITAMPLHAKMGMCRSDTAALKFEEVPVRDEEILGPIGSGGRVARRVLLRGRIGVGALALGLARDSLERATVYAQERKIGEGSLFDQPLTRAKLCRMEEDLWVAWQAVASAARLADESKPFKVQACMAKVFATETALRITDKAIQILGGYGYMRDYKVEQNYRDARLLTIGEGASEILRFAITRNLLATDARVPDVLPTAQGLSDAEGSSPGSAETLWGSGWQALQLATEAAHLVRARIREGPSLGEAGSVWQPWAVEFADLATKLWVAICLLPIGTRLAKRGGPSPKHLKLIRTYLVTASLTVCRQAWELVRTLGLSDSRLLDIYTTLLRMGT